MLKQQFYTTIYYNIHIATEWTQQLH